MFNVSTCCRITLAFSPPLWERWCSFLLSLVSTLADAQARIAGWMETEVTKRTVATLWSLGARTDIHTAKQPQGPHNILEIVILTKPALFLKYFSMLVVK